MAARLGAHPNSRIADSAMGMNRQERIGTRGPIQPVTEPILKDRVSNAFLTPRLLLNGLSSMPCRHFPKYGQRIASEAGTSPCEFMSSISVRAVAANLFGLRRPGLPRIRFSECWGSIRIVVTSAKSGSTCSSPEF